MIHGACVSQVLILMYNTLHIVGIANVETVALQCLFYSCFIVFLQEKEGDIGVDAEYSVILAFLFRKTQREIRSLNAHFFSMKSPTMLQSGFMIYLFLSPEDNVERMMQQN